MNQTNNILNNIKKWLTTVKKVCPECEGKGKIECNCNRITKMEQCYWCSGTGKTTKSKEVKQINVIGKCDACGGNKVQHCPTCSGTGKIKNQNGDSIKCLKCMGSGIIQCEVCKGTGEKKSETINTVKENVSCTHCNGKGELRCTSCDSNHEKKCYKCKGKGKYVSTMKVILLYFTWIIIIGLSLRFFYITIALIILLIALKIRDKKGNANNKIKSEISAEQDNLNDLTHKNAVLYPLNVNGRFGYKDSTGNTVIVPQFDEVGNFSEGLAKVKLGSKWGYLDATGELVIDPQFDEASDFNNGTAIIKNEGKFGNIDTNGNIEFK